MAVETLLCSVVTLENLSEGDVIDVQEYIEKLRFFKKFCYFGPDNRYKREGTYITDHRYNGHSDIGLHYNKYDTLIKYLSQHYSDVKKVRVCFSNSYRLYFEVV